MEMPDRVAGEPETDHLIDRALIGQADVGQPGGQIGAGLPAKPVLRRDDDVGLMAGVAANLSDEEIQGLATYIEGLHNVADAPSDEAVAAAAAAPVEAAPAEAAPVEAAPGEQAPAAEAPVEAEAAQG